MVGIQQYQKSLLDSLTAQLPDEQKLHLASNISQSLTSQGQEVPVLLSLLNSIDTTNVFITVLTQIYDRLSEFAYQIITDCHGLTLEQADLAKQIVNSLPDHELNKFLVRIEDTLLQWAHKALNAYATDDFRIESTAQSVVKNLLSLLNESNEADAEYTTDMSTVLCNIFFFIAVWLRDDKSTDLAKYSNIAILGLIFQNVSIQSVAREANKFVLTRQVMASLTSRLSSAQLWAETQVHLQVYTTAALYFLTAAVECDQFINNVKFQDFVHRAEFWSEMANQLVNGSAERRKLCVFVLDRAVNAVDTVIDFPGVFTFSPGLKEKYLQVWNKFFTLVDITAIDTSAHQTIAAMNDIQFLLAPSSASLIQSLWPICLLRMGFSATLSSVRVEFAKSVFDLSTAHLQVFNKDFKFLTNIFLPFVGQASFFTLDWSEEKPQCPHGTAVSEFVERVVHAFEDPVPFVHAVIRLLAGSGRKVFEAFAVFVMRGLLHGLRKGQPNLGAATCQELVRLCVDVNYENAHLWACIVQYAKTIMLEIAGRAELADVYDAIVKCQTACTELTWDVTEISKWFDKFDKNVKFDSFVINQLKAFLYGPDPMDNICKNGKPAAKELESKADQLTHLIRLHEIYKFPKLVIPKDAGRTATEIITRKLRNFQSSGKLNEIYQADSNIISRGTTLPYIHQYQYCSHMYIEVFELQLRLAKVRDKATFELERQLFALLDGIVLSQYNISNTWYNSEDGKRYGIDSGKIEKHIQYSIGTFIRLSEFAGGDLHESRARLRVFELTAKQIFSFLSKQTLDSKLIAIWVYAIRDVLPRAHSAEMILTFTDALSGIADELTVPQSDELKFVDLLLEMWDYLTDQTFFITRDSTNTKLLKLIFSNSILQRATNLKNDTNNLSALAHKLVPMGYARRGLLPLLADRFYDFQRKCRDEFVKSEWISPVLVEIYCFQQSTSNLFLIDEAVLEVVKQDDVSAHIENESFARARAAMTLGNLDGFNRKIIDAALNAVLTSKPKLFSRQLTDAASETHRVSLSEILLLLERWILDTEVEWYCEAVNYTLQVEFSPAVRTSLEWVLARLLMRSGKGLEKYLWTPLEKFDDKPRYLASLLTVGVVMTRSAIAKDDLEFGTMSAKRLMPVLLAYATTNRAVLRHTATSLILGLEDVQFVMALEIVAAMDIIKSHVLTSPTLGSFKYGDDVLWNVYNDYNLSSICGGVSARVSEHAHFTNRQVSAATFKLASSAWSDEDELIVPIGDAAVIRPVPASKSGKSKEKETGVTTLQTKSNTRLPTPRPVRTTKGKLIILASLVDKAPNLGGICRLADVLGAELLCIPDINMLNNRDFQSVAVTADKWMPIKEVLVSGIPHFLHECKARGYKVWGIEQTDNSVLLSNELMFPQKLVLILGKEKEGIPPELLRELDTAVEIKQVGIVRSMNIQTATAVVVQAYAAQHC
ncbi:hypothetical protein V1512DRAFT_280871, partial [Lipomyces arxii]|uniref:uncharacterized protein n=1 Tax=Lipomyces arxii TaxID=56418 RepID=UPI0034CECA29